MRTLLGLSLLILTILLITNPPISADAQQAKIPTPKTDEVLQPIKTTSKFSTDLRQITQVIPKQTVYKDDPQEEAGVEKVADEGADGTKVFTIKITYYEGQEDTQEIINTKITPAKDKIIIRGTKVIWRDLATSDGNFRYWKKLRVWATHYDSHCGGCNEWTATGLRAGKGVIAVDPKVIKLGTHVFIPGYGPAIAGDTGGAIKGNIIDLGFEDARTAGWSARYTDIYLLN